MKTNKIHYCFLKIFMLTFPFCVGGYYVYYCALANVMLIIGLLFAIFLRKQVNISKSFEFVAITVIAVAYLVVKFWALDSSMSIHGFIKILTPFLFMLNIFQLEKEHRNQVFYTVLYSAALMTAVTFILGQFEKFESMFYDEAGDLHGAFQYANTYAVFVLIGFFIGIMKPHKNTIERIADYVCSLICAIGIYLSNSRAVLAISGVMIIFVLYCTAFMKIKTKNGKIALVILTVITVIVAVAAIFFSGFAEKAYEYITTDGSFVERSLYYTDALKYAVKHPFGKGAYAFYYGQPEFQSAYYYAIDVHNDYLQFMVEIGIIPTLIFVSMIIKRLFFEKGDYLQKIVLLIISIHCLVDYDLQFMSIWCILILCFGFNKERLYEFKGKFFVVVAFCGVLCLNFLIGISAYYNFIGRHDKSIYYYKNTSSMVILMSVMSDQKTGYEYANNILDMNDSIFEANHVLSDIYATNKEYDKSIAQMELVLKKDPREMGNYEDYIVLCDTAFKYYSGKEDMDSAQKCRNKILSVPKKLKALKKSTPERAKKYGRKQRFNVSKEYRKIIKSYKQM